ncbi:unnamed protein product [Caenorhabditis auriculariae]|uniref:Gelsolin-like domain-containing protein n=1 Tax=Caenorhabditis auriculariae TaxID=2777116 RepID=A0A8S1GWU9_9PELO|nr:unnamed protein product [Caenorhabditis auriculariae]
MSTGVLQFVKGIDFSRNDFSGERFPHDVEQMTQMTWLKLNRSNLEQVPDELSRCENLEHLQMARNQLTSVHGELSDLPRLRSVIVRHNNLKTAGIPTDIFRMKDLTIIDLSHNQLREVPPNLEYAKGAIVLNLSHNNIETIPNAVCANLIDLLFLDVSNNKLDILPPQMRRLTMLQSLKLSHNPLLHFQLKQLPSMTALNVLHMRNTNRTIDNIPPALDDLQNLRDVDFAENNLSEVPDALFKLKNLRKLDLSSNKITKINLTEGEWEQLETLNVSSNELSALPDCLVKLSRLQKLYASDNRLTFEGIPSGIGKLLQLTVLHLSFNQLELVPEGVSRCVKLQRLRLDHNRLITLPDGVHLLPDLKELDLHENENLVMPPKPNDARKKLAFYNIDFSLEHQKKLAGQMASPSSSVSSIHSGGAQKDALARRKEFIRRRKAQADQQGADKVIQGMSKIAGAGVALKEQQEAEEEIAARSAVNWKKNIEKQRKNLDYSDIFDDDVGHDEGLWLWEIENFYPSIMDEAFHGQFYDADCYLVLKTTKEISGQLRHAIYYWLGEHATLDKGMCAAVHAVGLRNHLNATCRTIREEMNDESEEFLMLFGEEVMYIEGARTSTGFYTTEKPPHVTRLYRASVNGTAVEMEPVPLSVESLDPRFCFLLDAGDVMWIWSGARSRITVSNKARLFAERLNKRDRKGKSEIETCRQLKTPPEFWQALMGVAQNPGVPLVEHVPEDFLPERKRLYQVNIGMGFLELPQVELPKGVAKQEMLNTKCVYILDATSDIFLWTGKKANRLLKMAGQKMVVELHQMLERPDYAQVYRETEDEESMMFRSKFAGWDEIVPVDFTRTSESVQRVPDLKVLIKRDNMMKTDLAALFLDRQPAMSFEESEDLLQECNEDLELMESFVLEGRKFVKLPQREFGTFYTMDCYVFLCRYAVLLDDEDDDGSHVGDDDEVQTDFKCVLYFWQGRDASNMGWLNFTFQLQPNFEDIFKDKLEVVRMYQQQENHKFLSHFKRKFLIRRGRRGLTRNMGGKWPELFQMRANGSSVCTRTIQIDCVASQLCSAFCHILRIPFKEPNEFGERGIVYVWLGKDAEHRDHEYAQQVASDLIIRDDDDSFPVRMVAEGEENEQFWAALNGQKKYQTDSEFVQFTRLFRCTNEKGYFAVSEKTVDFCQDDLDDDDIMILDNGEIIFLWIGARASEIEAKLAYKAATVYQAHMKMKQTDRPRKLMLALKNHESSRFRKCFHAWGKHKVAAGTD